MIVLEDLEIEKKLEILSDAAKYDVACTSSGVERKGSQEGMGNATHCGICHSFAADGRCISLLKVLMTNECIYDCKYCINRRSNDTVRTSFTPQELCGLTIQFYRRNYIEGLFLSSGIRRSPDETMEQIYRVLFFVAQAVSFQRLYSCEGHSGRICRACAGSRVSGRPHEPESRAADRTGAAKAGTGQDTGKNPDTDASDTEWYQGAEAAVDGWRPDSKKAGQWQQSVSARGWADIARKE